MLSESENATISLTAAVALVIFNIVLGHFLPPFHILFTPFVVSIATLLVVGALKETYSVWTSVVSYALIATNDCGIKLHGGGMHDDAGQGWINAFLLIGFGCSFIIILFTSFNNKKSSLLIKILSVLLFALLGCMHIYLFSRLGVGRYY